MINITSHVSQIFIWFYNLYTYQFDHLQTFVKGLPYYRHSARDSMLILKNLSENNSSVPSFCPASLAYLLAYVLPVTFPNYCSCLFLAYPLLFTHAFSHSSVKLIPNPCYLTDPLASISQTIWSQDHFILLKIIEDPKKILFCGLFLSLFTE